MFKEVADIKTADMLELPVPDAHFHNVAVKPSEMQKEMVASLAERAEKVRGGGVDSSVDNMLKITNDGRKLALDQRMLNDMLPDFEGSKINACVDNIYRIWEETADKKSAQLVFCDLSTPKNDGTFSVYNDIRKKLIERGVPESEVRFIHEADTDVKKKELFQKTRKGEVRVLLGSTQKMGAGTNVQDRLIALHDVDCPWRPSDLEQRSGRIIRQGNSNPDVDIYRYVTEQTFDAYLYQLVEGKQKFASQIMTSKSPVRSAEDIDETALSYAEIKMLATGNPYIKEKMDLDIQVQKLKLLKSNFLSERYALEDKIIKYYPQRITALENRIEGLNQDVETAKQHPKPTDDRFIKVRGMDFVEAVQTIMGNGSVSFPTCENIKSYEEQPLLLPEKSPTTDVVFEYLFGRGIDYEIINHCLEQELIIESLPYHNAVFIGYDENKEPKYAAYRATNQSRIMGDCTGSKKQYSFRLTAENTGEVHLFECAIDLLSYATLMKLEGKDWRQYNLVSLAGVYSPKQKIEDSKVPVTLGRLLEKDRTIGRIVLHLDNDIAGRKATKALQTILSDKYEVVDDPPQYGKDVNDFLCKRLGIKDKTERSFAR